MRLVIQRVREASVTIEDTVRTAIGPGLLVLAGIENEDAAEDVEWLAAKLPRLRIFNDAAGQMNLSLLDTGGDVLVVSQFTLHASTRKGNRPSFIRAARPEIAIPLYEHFLQALQDSLGKPVAAGVFGAHMRVSLVNDGPVTILMDSRQRE